MTNVGVREEIIKTDCCNGDVAGYIREATQKWADLDPKNAQWKPEAPLFNGGDGDRATF
jgi:hypothetical protein